MMQLERRWHRPKQQCAVHVSLIPYAMDAVIQRSQLTRTPGSGLGLRGGDGAQKQFGGILAVHATGTSPKRQRSVVVQAQHHIPRPRKTDMISLVLSIYESYVDPLAHSNQCEEQ